MLYFFYLWRSTLNTALYYNSNVLEYARYVEAKSCSILLYKHDSAQARQNKLKSQRLTIYQANFKYG